MLRPTLHVACTYKSKISNGQSTFLDNTLVTKIGIMAVLAMTLAPHTGPTFGLIHFPGIGLATNLKVASFQIMDIEEFTASSLYLSSVYNYYLDSN